MRHRQWKVTTLSMPKSGPDITWAGRNPFGDGLFFGFEDGSFEFKFVKTGMIIRGRSMSTSKEAINGVAGIGEHSLAISTRADVSFIQFSESGKTLRSPFHSGAHGVIATKTGYFISPLGASGLLVVKPTSDPEQKMILTIPSAEPLYFCRIAALNDKEGKETLIFANRRDGVGFTAFEGEETAWNIHAMKFDGIDVVDVSAITQNSTAAVAITMTADVLWIKDASLRNDPIVTRLHGVVGPVYRVLATKSHLFVLSSKALYVWHDLVEQVLIHGKTVPSELPFVLPVQAADMVLLDDTQVLLLMGSNEVTIFETEEIDGTQDKEPVRIKSDFRPLNPSEMAGGPRNRVGNRILFDEAFKQAAIPSMNLSQRTNLEEIVPRWTSKDFEQKSALAAN